MPGRLLLTTGLNALGESLDADCADVADQPRRLNIAPGQNVVVLTPERRLVLMRWGIVPVGRVNARGRPVMDTLVNARSETVFAKSAFSGVGRGIVPADGWYEWTGERSRKTAWRIRDRDGALLLFAAITDVWTAPGGTALHQVATVTCEPSAEIGAIHHRMGVLLRPEDAETWLHGDPDEAAQLARPWPEGRLVIEQAANVDWSGP